MRATKEHNSLTLFGFNKDQADLLKTALRYFNNARFEHENKDALPKEKKAYDKRKEKWQTDKREVFGWITAIEELEPEPDVEPELQIEESH